MNTEAHDRTVTAFFDTRAAADKARADVITAGVPSTMVSLVEGHDTTRTANDPARGLEPHEEGFWGTLKTLFAPEEDKHAYAEGLSRGGFLVTVHTDDARYDRVIDILDDEGAVNMDEREAQWKSEGWTGRHDGAPAFGSSTAAAQGTAMPAATRLETSEAATLGAAAPAAMAGSRGTTTMTGDTVTAGREAALADRAVGERGTGLGDESLQLAEERLRVGKRDVNHGRVRLRSYIVETPVHEAVNLRSETVEVTRRPVDRALNAGENLFQERTISAEEHHEEAVVSKEAHVYEEVGLRKTAQDKVQEVNETVRRQELEVNDDRVAGGTGTALGALGSKIAEHMEVRDSSGTKVGSVDHYEGGDKIKLAKHDAPDGVHHYIPTSWISRVDNHVHLSKTADDVRSGWSAA